MARPKRVFSDELVQQIGEYALDGCQNNTIATILNVPLTTLKRRFGKLMTKKRCERRQQLRLNQTNLSKSNPAMAIFLGKNELGQVDKQVLKTEDEIPQVLTSEDVTELKRLAGLVTGIKLHKPAV